MSVALIIYRRDPGGTGGKAERSVPVSTESIFNSIWLPGARALNLRWVPLFQSGLELNDDTDWNEVFDELMRLKEWLQEVKVDQSVLERLTSLEKELAALRVDSERFGWIG